MENRDKNSPNVAAAAFRALVIVRHPLRRGGRKYHNNIYVKCEMLWWPPSAVRSVQNGLSYFHALNCTSSRTARVIIL